MPKRPSWENLDEFFDLGDFGCEAVFTLTNDTERTVIGIFDDPEVNANTGEYEFETRRPRLTFKESESSLIERGCKVVIEDETYDVLTEPQADGTGVVVVDLAEED